MIGDEKVGVVVAARPEPLAINLRTSAVLVVDMQNDFGAEGGMFARAGIPIAGIRAAAEATARVLGAARAAGMKVIYLTMQPPRATRLGSAERLRQPTLSMISTSSSRR